MRGIELQKKKSQNYSVLAFFSLEGLLAFSITRGSIDASTFSSLVGEFMKKKFKEDQLGKIKLIMDNAKIHIANLTKLLVNDFYHVLYLPPYTPQLNPIEYCFNKLKYLVKKKGLIPKKT
jgi:hypothetical protein